MLCISSSLSSPHIIAGQWPHPGWRAGTIYRHPIALILPSLASINLNKKHLGYFYLPMQMGDARSVNISPVFSKQFQSFPFRIKTFLKEGERGILIYSPISEKLMLAGVPGQEKFAHSRN